MGRGRSQGTPIAGQRRSAADGDGQLVAEARAIAGRLLGESAATLDLNPSMDRGELSATIAAACEQGGMNLVLALTPERAYPDWRVFPRKARRQPGVSASDWSELILAQWTDLIGWSPESFQSWTVRRVPAPSVSGQGRRPNLGGPRSGFGPIIVG